MQLACRDVRRREACSGTQTCRGWDDAPHVKSLLLRHHSWPRTMDLMACSQLQAGHGQWRSWAWTQVVLVQQPEEEAHWMQQAGRFGMSQALSALRVLAGGIRLPTRARKLGQLQDPRIGQLKGQGIGQLKGQEEMGQLKGRHVDYQSPRRQAS